MSAGDLPVDVVICPRSLNQEQASTLRRRAAEGVAKATLAREFGISRETVYQYLRAELAT